MAKKTEIIEAQRERGLDQESSGVRTEYHHWWTHNTGEQLLNLEVSILDLDRLMLELGRFDVPSPNQFHADITAQILDRSFYLELHEQESQANWSQNLAEMSLGLHAQGLLKHEMPHAVYRVQLYPNRLVLSSFTHAFAIGEGSGVEIELRPRLPMHLQFTYPAQLRTQAKFAVVHFCVQSDDQIKQESLLCYKEYQYFNGRARAVKCIESSRDETKTGYLIEVKENRYTAVE